MSAVNELVITPEFVTNIIAVDLADETTFTTADKAKLNGIEAGAQVNTVTKVAGKTGVVELDAGDIAYDASETYASGKIGAALKSAEEKLNTINAGDIGYDASTAYGSGTVGKELTELNRQISESITPAIEQLTEDLDGKAPVIINTASGEIASFADGADGMPVKSLVANIEPVQDLHGYDNPWPAGGGKNLLPFTGATTTINGVTFTVNSDGTVTANGTATSDAAFLYWDKNTFGGKCLQPGSYILNGCPSGGGNSTYRIASNGFSGWADIGNGSNNTIVEAMNQTNIVIVVSSGTTVSNLVFKPMIRLATETDATFAPYSNICPISGHTGASVEQTGANMFDEVLESGSINSANGQNIQNANVMRSKNYISIKPSTAYCFLLPWAQIFWYDANKNYISYDNNNVTEDGKIYAKVFTSPANAYYCRLRCSGTYGTTYRNDISVNYPATDTEYHPYTGNQISVDWETEAGTVYGGTLDVTNGVLTVDRAMVDLGEVTWVFTQPSSEFVYGYFTAAINGKAAGRQNIICSKYQVLNASSLEGVDKACLGSAASSNFFVVDSDYSDAATFKTSMAGVQLVYELATPITYQLTPQELNTLLGQNNIWTDVGTVDVEYPADTKLYIEQLTKPTEDDMTADHAISAGTFFMIGNTLYLATSQIAAGGTITPGTNATQLSLADALNQLNT